MKPACRIPNNYPASWLISSNQLSNNLLYTCSISTTFCLFYSQRHDTFKLLALLFNQSGDYRSQFIITQLRTLNIGLQNLHLALFFFNKLVTATLFIKRNCLTALFYLLFQNLQTISFS